MRRHFVDIPVLDDVIHDVINGVEESDHDVGADSGRELGEVWEFEHSHAGLFQSLWCEGLSHGEALGHVGGNQGTDHLSHVIRHCLQLSLLLGYLEIYNKNQLVHTCFSMYSSVNSSMCKFSWRNLFRVDADQILVFHTIWSLMVLWDSYTCWPLSRLAACHHTHSTHCYQQRLSWVQTMTLKCKCSNRTSYPRYLLFEPCLFAAVMGEQCNIGWYSRVAGTMVACSPSVRAITCLKPSQVPPLLMHVGKWPAAPSAAKRSAHVAPEVNLRERIMYASAKCK